MRIAVRLLGVIFVVVVFVLLAGLAAFFMATEPTSIISYKPLGGMVLPAPDKKTFTYKGEESGFYTIYIKYEDLSESSKLLSDQERNAIGKEIIEACSDTIDLDCTRRIFDTNLPKEIDRSELLQQCHSNPYGVHCRDVLQDGEMKWKVVDTFAEIIASGDYRTRRYFDVTDKVLPLGRPFKLEEGQEIKIVFFRSTKHYPIAVRRNVKVLIGKRK